MAALPYIQLYIADYLADTAHLTTEQHGAYLLLIFNYWQRGQALNNTNERLASVARMSNEAWNANKQTLEEFFEIDGNTWTNARIDEDLASVASKSTKASLAGKASGARRRADSKRKTSGRSTDVQRTVNHTEAEADTYTERATSRAIEQQAARSASRFPEFWDVYPLKKGKSAAEAKWKARKLDAIADRIIDDVRDRMTNDRQWLDGFIPHGSTYVNGKGWEDEIVKTATGQSRQNAPSKTFSALQNLQDSKRHEQARPELAALGDHRRIDPNGSA